MPIPKKPKPQFDKKALEFARVRRHTFFTKDAKLKITQFAATADKPARTVLEGYPITWNTVSSDRGGYAVRLKPGSAQAEKQVTGTFHHNFSDIIGNTA